MSQHAVWYADLSSPLGALRAVGDEHALIGLYFAPHRGRPAPLEPGWQRDRTRFDVLAEQLEAYFAGTRTSFDLEIRFPKSTDFRRRVWSQLRAIPYGQTVSYGQLAKRLGLDRGARAVGAANAHNPLSIVVPCHRVIGANGALTGYAGGAENKAHLLALERKVSGSPRSARRS